MSLVHLLSIYTNGNLFLPLVTNGRALNAAIGTDGMPLVNLFTNDCHLVLSIGTIGTMEN
jgi:hypothetical protein